MRRIKLTEEQAIALNEIASRSKMMEQQNMTWGH